MRRGIGVLLLLGLALELTACQVQVTPDGSAYSYSAPSDGTVVVSAPSTSGINNREFFWSPASPVEADASACATFDSERGQPGIALRINGLNPTPTRAITVTENFYDFVYNVFNFHLWDLSQSPPYTSFGETTISALLPDPPTHPLHMCARTVGNTVQFVVWLNAMPRPAWGDPTWGGEATLPAASPPVGLTGYYVGHIAPGISIRFSHLTVDGVTNSPIS